MVLLLCEWSLKNDSGYKGRTITFLEGGYEKFSSANIFFKDVHPCKHFFPYIIFFSFVLTITIVLLNYSTKNVLSSAPATYFVDVHSTHLLKILAATDANKGHTTGNRRRDQRAFSRSHSTEVLILFDDVPTGYHTRTIRPVVPGRHIADLKWLPLPWITPNKL